MAKRIGVLDPDDPFTTDLSACPQFCTRNAAKYLVRKLLAVQITPRIIRMVKVRAARCVVDGPLGVGNLIPFAKPHSSGDKLHYEIPRAGDRGIFARHRRPRIRVSGRNLFSVQRLAMPAPRVVAGRELAG